MIIQRLITAKFRTCFGRGEVENSGEENDMISPTLAVSGLNQRSQ